jgi:hypothetical protein
MAMAMAMAQAATSLGISGNLTGKLAELGRAAGQTCQRATQAEALSIMDPIENLHTQWCRRGRVGKLD